MSLTGISKGKTGTVNYTIAPANRFSWGRKSTLTLIALLASIALAFYDHWTAGGVTMVFGTLLGIHHSANVAESKLK